MGEWILLAADKYDIKGLKKICEGMLCQGLSVGNTASRLVLSAQTKASELKRACFAFIKDNSAQVRATSEWLAVTGYQSGALLAEVLDDIIGVLPDTKKMRI